MKTTDAGIYRISQVGTTRAYIGSSANIRRRWNAHRRELRAGVHHNSKLQRAWTRHGEAAFRFERIEACPAHALIAREQHWLDTASPYFNLSPVAGRPGGRVGPHSEATKAKIREARSRQIIRREDMEPAWEATRGALRTVATRERISAALTGKFVSEQTREKLRQANLGKKHSAETRAKQSAALTGKERSPEHRANLAAALTGKKLSPETIAKRQASRAANAARKAGA